MHPVKSTISTLTIGLPETFRGLTLFPLSAAKDSSIDYLLLGEAVKADVMTVREVSESGSVPELLVENRAPLPVLIVDGEELVGAKQNRVANLTLLVPAESTLTIPVSCVEAGRWAAESDEFELSERVHHASGRASKMESVHISMCEYGTRESDQDAIWRDIDEKADAMDAHSPTSAMAAIFDRYVDTLNALVDHFQASADQSGGLFAIGNRVWGLDLFDKPATFSALLPKLVRSYGIDVLGHSQDASVATDENIASDFLAAICRSEIEDRDAVGLGRDIRVVATDVTAGGLEVDGTLVHLAAFPKQQRSSSRRADSNMLRASLRRRFREID